MSKKTFASNKQFRDDTTDPTQHHISSRSALSTSKRPSNPAERSRIHKNGSRRHKSAVKKLLVLQCEPKPTSSYKTNSAGICQVKTNAGAKTVSRKKNFHGTHRQSPAPAGSQQPQVESAKMAADAKICRQKLLASVSTISNGSQKPRSQSNPLRASRKDCWKLHSSRSTVFQPTYVCEKHKRLTNATHKATRLSAGDSRLSELANDVEEVKYNPNASASQTTPRPQPSSYTLPFVLSRKLKHGEDTSRIPADAVHGASSYRHEFMRLGKQNPAPVANKDPNNCNIKVIRFHNVEIIEQHDPQMEQEGKVILKIIHKSRQLQQPQKRLNLISNENTALSKEIMEHIFKRWTEVIKMWKQEGYLLQAEPYETVEYDAQQHRTPELPSSSSSSSSSLSVDLERQNSVDNMEHHVSHDQAVDSRKMIRDFMVKKGPAYQETITTQLRYNFRRKKRFYPVHLMEHVLKYKRPPFWNYSRNYRGFNVLLNKYQLDNLYELVQPRQI